MVYVQHKRWRAAWFSKADKSARRRFQSGIAEMDTEGDTWLVYRKSGRQTRTGEVI